MKYLKVTLITLLMAIPYFALVHYLPELSSIVGYRASESGNFLFQVFVLFIYTAVFVSAVLHQFTKVKDGE